MSKDNDEPKTETQEAPAPTGNTGTKGDNTGDATKEK